MNLKKWLELILFAALLTGPINAAQAGLLHLGGRQFDPLIESTDQSIISDSPTVMKRVTQTEDTLVSETSGTGYYIIQFKGPILPQWRTYIEDAGATVLDYIPTFAYIIRLPQNKKDAVKAFEHVRWLGPYEADYRISSEAKALSFFSTTNETLLSNGQVKLRIDVFPGESGPTITDEIENLGGSIQNITESPWGIRINATLDEKNIQDAAKIPGIKWVELCKPRRTSNEIAAGIIDIRPVRTRADGLYGAGQIVAVCDSGLDKGSITDIHPDFLDGYGNSRVLDIFSWGDDSYLSDLSGHGNPCGRFRIGQRNPFRSLSCPKPVPRHQPCRAWPPKHC